MSELARITAHYLAVLLEAAGRSAAIPDMRAELEAAAEADAGAAAAAERARLAGSVDTKIDRLVEESKAETERGRKARRQV